MKTQYLIMTLALISSLDLTGQALEVGYGHFGAMIFWQGPIPKTGKAEVKRSSGGIESQVWHVRPAQNEVDVRQNISRMPPLFKDLFTFNAESVDFYLEKLNSASRVESIPNHFAPNVLFALGLAVWDTTVVQGETYLYQAIVDGNATSPASALETTLNQDFDWTPTFASGTNDERIIRCRWLIPYDKKPEVYGFLGYRTAPFVPDYQLIQGIEAFTIAGDTINAVFMDTTALEAPGVYHYMIRTFNRFGLLGPPSEYGEGSNYGPVAEPVIVYFKAVGMKDKPAIQLNWRLLNSWRVRSLALYRSRSWDGPYELIKHFSPDDSTYVDQITDVMESYFYYFEMDDIAQQDPVVTTKVTTVSEYVWPAQVPDSVTAVAEGPAIRVSWKKAGFQDRGYYVMRAEGYGEPDLIVSPFIHASDNATHYSWLDTSSQLKGDEYYTYSVISESIGYDQSPQAEPASARPDVPVYIAAPSDLKLTRETDTTFLLRWRDLSGEESNNHYGYQVFQKDPKAEGGYRVLTPEPLTFETNYYILDRITPRDTFIVRAYNIFGNASAHSEEVALLDPFFFKFGPEYVMGQNEANGVRLRWNRPLRADVTQYRIYRISGDGAKSEIAKVPVTETTYLDTKVKSGETYYYFITADARGGLSSEASETLFIAR